MTSIPLLHAPEEVLVWRGGAPVRGREFLADVAALARQLPPGDIVNLCEDRYHFMVAFAATVFRGGRNLLPPSRAEQVVTDLLAAHPGATRIDDAALANLGAAGDLEPPMIPAARTVAVLFTSGSTGQPKAQAKSWGELVGGARLLRPRLPFGGSPAAIVATVPPQHMYGLETTVMQPLATGAQIESARPFFPGDIRERLAAAPGSRALITTPLHLKSCLDAGLDWPPLDFVLSATAPMPLELAQRAEAILGAPLLEIYGSTETGAIATRRTAEEDSWQPLEGVQVTAAPDGALARAAHLPEPVTLNDQVDGSADGRFKLLGRSADLIKIAGKRASLAELNHVLSSIAGVRDGVFVLPDGENARLAAVVAVEGVGARELLDRLRRQIDPVFLPRPLVLVDRLPRNETGKLPRQQLLELLRRSEPKP